MIICCCLILLAASISVNIIQYRRYERTLSEISVINNNIPQRLKKADSIIQQKGIISSLRYFELLAGKQQDNMDSFCILRNAKILQARLLKHQVDLAVMEYKLLIVKGAPKMELGEAKAKWDATFAVYVNLLDKTRPDLPVVF